MQNYVLTKHSFCVVEKKDKKKIVFFDIAGVYMSIFV